MFGNTTEYAIYLNGASSGLRIYGWSFVRRQQSLCASVCVCVHASMWECRKRYSMFCREDMEKVNIVFHNNGTVSYQHKKILNFVPEMSKDANMKVIVPNIPLLVSYYTSEAFINTIYYMFMCWKIYSI